MSLSTSNDDIENFLGDEANKYTQRNTHSDIAEEHQVTLINNSQIFVVFSLWPGERKSRLKMHCLSYSV